MEGSYNEGRRQEEKTEERRKWRIQTGGKRREEKKVEVDSV